MLIGWLVELQFPSSVGWPTELRRASPRFFWPEFLGREAFGLYAIGWALVKVGSLIGTLGLDQGVIRFGSRFWPDKPGSLKRVVRLAVFVSLSFSTIISLLVFLGSRRIAVEVFGDPSLTPVLRIISIALPFSAGLRVGASATLVTVDAKYAAIAQDLLRPIANLLLVIVLAYIAGLQLFGALLATLLSFALGFAVVTTMLIRLYGGAMPRPPESAVKMVRPLLSFSVPVFLAGLSGTLIAQSDKLFLGYFLAPRNVGVYQAAAQSAIVFSLILGSFNAIFSPMIAGLHERGEHDRLNALFKISTKWGLYISLPVFAVFFVFSRDIMTLVFGLSYASGWKSFTILSAAQIFNVGTGSVGLMLLMTGRQNLWLLITSTMVGVSFGANLLLIPLFGIEGAAFATGLAILGQFALGLVAVWYFLKLWPYDLRYLKGILSAALTLLLLGFAANHLGSDSAVRVVVGCCISAAAFFGILIGLRLDEEDKVFIRMVRRFVHRFRIGGLQDRNTHS